MAAFEAQLGVRLFNRTTRSLSPTEVGHVFYEEARAVLGAVNAAAGAGRGGGLSDAISAVMNSFGGARAEGGPVLAGGAYLVGERGPELLDLPRGSRVIENARSLDMMRKAASGGGGVLAAAAAARIRASVDIAPPNRRVVGYPCIGRCRYAPCLRGLRRSVGGLRRSVRRRRRDGR